MNNFSDREEKETEYMLLIFDMFTKFKTCPYCQMYIKLLDKGDILKKQNIENTVKIIESSHDKKNCFVLSAGWSDLEDDFDPVEVNAMVHRAWMKINELIKERDEFKNNLRRHKK